MFGDVRKKKLVEAARYWLEAGKGDRGSLIQDMEVMGAQPEMIRAVQGQLTQEGFDIWPDNWSAWCAFMAVSSQWLLAPSGRPIGLNYACVQAGLNLAKIELSQDDFFKLRIIEKEVVSICSEER